MYVIRQQTFIALTVVLFASCDLEATEPVARVEPEEVSFDANLEASLAAVIERTRRAFVRDGSVLRGGDAVVGASVSARGIEVTPYAWGSEIKGHRAQTSTRGRSLHLETSAVQRGGNSATAASRVELAADGTAMIRRDDDVIEHVRAADRAVEQFWTFESPPRGSGDLVVRVTVSGQRYGGRTPLGLHFVDDTTGLGFSYSDGTWIDARGVESHIPAVYDGGDILLTVGAELLAASEFPAILDPTISAEYGFDNPLFGPAGGTQATPDIAYSGVSGAEYLAVWSDSRRETDFHYDIRAARITANGTVVDQVGLHVPTLNFEGDQFSPAVAWTDDPDGGGGVPGHWFVVWTAMSVTSPGESMIRGVRIQADWTGMPALAPDFDVSNRQDFSSETEPDITASPSTTGRFAVAYRKTLGGVEVRTFAKSAASAGLADTTEPTSQSTARSPAIAAGDQPNSTNAFLAVWADTAIGAGNIYGRSISGTDSSMGSQLSISTQAAAQYEPAVAYAGATHGWIAAWTDERNIVADIYAQKINNTATALTGNNTLLSTSSPNVSAPGSQARAAIAGGPGNLWFVSWQDNRSGIDDIYGTRIIFDSGSITSLHSSGLAVSTSAGVQVDPTVTYNTSTSDFMVAWSDGRASSASPDIYGARVASVGSVLDASGILLGRSANQQEAPATAACAGRYLVVWTDTRNGADAPDLYGAITDNASPPNVLVSNIAISTAAGRQDLPDVACNANDFFVVWADDRNATRDIYGARVRASDGVVLDPSGIAIATTAATATDPAISYQGYATTFQVVWADNRNGHYDVFGKRIATNGVVNHASEVSISGSLAGDQVRPDVTPDNNFNGTTTARFFVVWQDGRPGGEFVNWDIYGRYVEVNGSLGAQIAIATNSQDDLAPAVATRPATSVTSGRGQVVVFERVMGVEADILATSISPTTSTVVSSVNVTSSVAIDDREPVISHRSGSAMVISYRSAAISETLDFAVFGQDITFNPLATSGAAFGIANVFGVRERSPAIACGSGTGCQVAYRKYMEGPSSGGPPPLTLFAIDRVRGVRLSY